MPVPDTRAISGRFDQGPGPATDRSGIILRVKLIINPMLSFHLFVIILIIINPTSLFSPGWPRALHARLPPPPIIFAPPEVHSRPGDELLDTIV